MKYLLAVLAFSFFAHASDVAPKTESEFTHIQPVAVEEAPVVKAVEVTTLDSDSDGVLDKDDKCPNTQAGEKVDASGCMIKLDSDKDGVPDEDDKCPNTAAGTKVDDKGCELDSDDDGVVDSKDQCPDTSKDFVVNGYGCPQTATLKVNFATNKYNVSDELIDDLKTFAMFLKDNPGYQIIIYGYTDSVGNEQANKKLSQNRANAVKEALSRYGINTTKMTAIGKGEADPVADNETKEGRAQNRRIEVELLQ
ncbi:OmpA family protein [Sulfurimonas sp.]|uniref:OmpA family protein n=1 Tax=Sulfurimonas sp. TaxID=2022749 RepID=UPI003564FC0E